MTKAPLGLPSRRRLSILIREVLLHLCIGICILDQPTKRVAECGTLFLAAGVHMALCKPGKPIEILSYSIYETGTQCGESVSASVGLRENGLPATAWSACPPHLLRPERKIGENGTVRCSG